MELNILEILVNLIIINAFFVIMMRNAVHSVILLILVFLNASLIMFLFNFEYLALTMLIIYVGAIAVLFLFVVMMLNIKSVGFLNYYNIILLIIILIFYAYFSNLIEYYSLNFYEWNNIMFKYTDLEVIGISLYGYYFFYVLLAGILLLISMIGAIFLTMAHSIFVKRQKIYFQLNKDLLDTIKYYKEK